jgi:hypothetical protein
MILFSLDESLHKRFSVSVKNMNLYLSFDYICYRNRWSMLNRISLFFFCNISNPPFLLVVLWSDDILWHRKPQIFNYLFVVTPSSKWFSLFFERQLFQVRSRLDILTDLTLKGKWLLWVQLVLARCWQTLNFAKSKSLCDWRSVSQYVLVSSPNMGLLTRDFFFESFSLVIFGAPSLTRSGSVMCQSCFWVYSSQSVFTIIYIWFTNLQSVKHIYKSNKLYTIHRLYEYLYVS